MKKEPEINGLFMAIVLFYLAVSLGMTVLAAVGISVRLPAALSLISGELTLLIPTVCYLLVHRTRIGSISERWRLPISVIPMLIVLAYCILPFISLVNLISMLIGGSNAVVPVMGMLRKLPPWVSFLCVAVLPGVLEEFIFRGLIYSEYRKRRVWGAIVASALLFGLMHMNLNQFCYAFVMGIIFCMLYEGTGSLLAPMLVHAVYNGNSVLMTYLMDSEEWLEAAGSGSQEALGQVLGSSGMSYELLIVILGITVVALIGLTAAGGLYVAIIKLCHRENCVKLLFQRNAMDKRMILSGEIPAEKQRQETETEGVTENDDSRQASGKLWGPLIWCAVILCVGVILWELLI